MPIPQPHRRYLSLALFCLATPLLISLELFLPGAVLWLAGLTLALTDPESAFKRRMGTLYAVVALLAAAPIHTDTSNAHVVAIAIPFFLVIAGPAVFLGKTDPGVIRYRFWPRKFRWLDIFYVAISIPLAWAAFEFYFGMVNPEVTRNWTLPPVPDEEEIWRLFAGINAVGIWDELFFVNTVYAVLRSLFSFRVANAAQAVVYTAVLYDMAFTGIGPVLIYLFALTQGSMFEESENLLYVLIVHLIVDAFLFSAIVHSYYPGYDGFLL